MADSSEVEGFPSNVYDLWWNLVISPVSLCITRTALKLCCTLAMYSCNCGEITPEA
jgi:hypothetical protein